MPHTIRHVIDRLKSELPNLPELPTPPFTPDPGKTDRCALAVSSMKDHTTDEGWQIMLALQSNGYFLWGKGCSDLGGLNCTDVREIFAPANHPYGTCLMQDKREWHLNGPRDFRDPEAEFRHVSALRSHHEIFRLTILKDAQQRPNYHRDSAAEIGCHAWVVYYHPQIVKALAPYVRARHLVRTYHTIDPQIVPPYSPKDRKGCLLSGAVSGAYPLRTRIANESAAGLLRCVDYLRHPGYHRDGCATPVFLTVLSRYKVAICTASRYGYALRKLVEATAAGCTVITDLPEDEVMPAIDANLCRVPPDCPTWRVRELVGELESHYDPERQALYARAAVDYYSYLNEGRRLADKIEALRSSYS